MGLGVTHSRNLIKGTIVFLIVLFVPPLSSEVSGKEMTVIICRTELF